MEIGVTNPNTVYSYLSDRLRDNLSLALIDVEEEKLLGLVMLVIYL